MGVVEILRRRRAGVRVVIRVGRPCRAHGQSSIQRAVLAAGRGQVVVVRGAVGGAPVLRAGRHGGQQAGGVLLGAALRGASGGAGSGQWAVGSSSSGRRRLGARTTTRRSLSTMAKTDGRWLLSRGGRGKKAQEAMRRQHQPSRALLGTGASSSFRFGSSRRTAAQPHHSLAIASHRLP